MVWPSGGNCPAPTRGETCAGGWRGEWHKDSTVTPAAKKAVTESVGCACAPFLCPGSVVRGAHPTTVSTLNLCIGGGNRKTHTCDCSELESAGAAVGATLCGCPGVGGHIGPPLHKTTVLRTVLG